MLNVDVGRLLFGLGKLPPSGDNDVTEGDLEDIVNSSGGVSIARYFRFTADRDAWRSVVAVSVSGDGCLLLSERFISLGGQQL